MGKSGIGSYSMSLSPIKSPAMGNSHLRNSGGLRNSNSVSPAKHPQDPAARGSGGRDSAPNARITPAKISAITGYMQQAPTPPNSGAKNFLKNSTQVGVSADANGVMTSHVVHPPSMKSMNRTMSFKKFATLNVQTNQVQQPVVEPEKGEGVPKETLGLGHMWNGSERDSGSPQAAAVKEFF